MSPEEECSRMDGTNPPIAAALAHSTYPSSISPTIGKEPCASGESTATDLTSRVLDNKEFDSQVQENLPAQCRASVEDVEQFDGKIVYNPNGSAYIIEGESELSEDDSLPDGCIVDGRGIHIPHSLVIPQIENAFYVSKFYSQHSFKSPMKNPEMPMMHSFRVTCYRNADGSKQPSMDVPPIPFPSAGAPLKPILMCFVCKLSFGQTKSFVAHAQFEHQINLLEDEKIVLSDKSTSAIIQCCGKSKEPLISFLEPMMSPADSNLLEKNIPHFLRKPFNEAEHFKNTLAYKPLNYIVNLLNKGGAGGSSEQEDLLKSQLFGNNDQSETNRNYDCKWSNPAETETSDLSSYFADTNLVSPNFYANSLANTSVTQQPVHYVSGTTIGLCSDHMQGRHSEVDCSKCEFLLNSSRLSVSSPQIASIHSRNSCKTLKCPKCNWHYKYQETLEIHMKEKHPDSETSCIYCLSNQPHPRLARGETYTCGYKPYRCEVCNYSTTTKGNLSIHMQSDKHLNNMQELQGSTSSNPNNSSSGNTNIMSCQTPNNFQNQPPNLSQSLSQTKYKPSFRCDVCNYETNVARNLRIHMTSEKHTHNMLVIQRNVEHLQTLSSLQSQSSPVSAIQPKNNFELFNLENLDKLPAQKSGLSDAALHKAIFLQMVSNGHFLSQANRKLQFLDYRDKLPLSTVVSDSRKDGMSLESEEPMPEREAASEPDFIYQCCICSNYSTDSVEDLSLHLSIDRTKTCEGEILNNVAGNFTCKLCSYKTSLKANFQLHCKTDKHLQRLQIFNHIKEGGTKNEWKVKDITSTMNLALVRCQACDYYTNNIHKLLIHSASPKHEQSAHIIRFLRDESNKSPAASKLYLCKLCKFSAKDRLVLMQHVRSTKHFQMEQIYQHNRKKDDNEDPNININDIFQVVLDPSESLTDMGSNRSTPVTPLRSNNDEKINFSSSDAKELRLDRGSADEKALKLLQYHAEKSMPNSGNSAMQNDAEMRNASENPNEMFVEKMICPLCQDIFKCRFQLEKHVMQIHSVNADGLQRLLVLVNQSHWLNLDNRNFTDVKPLISPIPAEKLQKPFEEEPSYPNKAEESSKFSSPTKSASSENQAPRDFNLMAVPNSTISEKHVYKYRCGKCSLAFQTLNKLELHSQYHVFRDARKCIFCGRSFRSVNALSRHLENFHSDMNDKKKFDSPQPSQKPTAKNSNFGSEALDQPQQPPDDKNTNNSKSILQNNQISTQKINSLEDYMNSDNIAQSNYNELIRKYKCQDCRVAYTRQRYLVYHNKFHSRQKKENITMNDSKVLEISKSFQCDTCGENFSEKNILFVHCKSVNHCYKIKMASESNMADGSTKQMVMGESLKSFDQKPFKCYICKISYYHNYMLELHKQSSFHSFQVLKSQNSHDSNRLMKNKSLADLFFSEENKAFNSNEKDTEKTIACPKCNSGFSDIKQLINHQQICCMFDNPLALIQKFMSPDDMSRCDLQNLQTSLSYTQFLEKYSQQFEQKDVSLPPKQKTSHIYKHLLESFGFDLVMQFNESHQKRKLLSAKDEFNLFAAKEMFCAEQNESKDTNGNKAAICQICNQEFSSVLVLKAHSEEVHNDLLPQEFLEKYIQDFKKEYERKVVVVTAATSSSTSSTPTNSKNSEEKVVPPQNSKVKEQKVSHFNKEPESSPLANINPAILSLSSSMFPTDEKYFSQSKGMPKKASQETPEDSMSKMQIALNVIAASRLQQQMQGYPGFMVNMMGLPTAQNMSTVAAMNIQPPLFSTILKAQPDEANMNTFSAVPQPAQLLTNNLNVLQPQQSNVAAPSCTKRARTRITDDQLKILRAHFDINNSPGEDQIHEMASQSGLPAKVIKHWFRNTLFKERQRNKDSPYNFNNPPSTVLNLEEYEKTGETKADVTETDVSSKNSIKYKSELKAFSPISSPDTLPNSMCVVDSDKMAAGKCATPSTSTSFEDSFSAVEKSCKKIYPEPLAMLPPPKSDIMSFSSENMMDNPLNLPMMNADRSNDSMLGDNSMNMLSQSSSGKRANRTRFTDYQIKVLQEFFENNAYPKDDDLEYLSKLLGLSPRVIVVWFQNARQKARKVYENQPQAEQSMPSIKDNEETASRFQKTSGLNYQCKKCTLVFQRYYELIRHQKTHCFKEEDAKRSAQAQAAAAQVAAVLSSEDSNSSSNTTINMNNQNSLNSQNLGESMLNPSSMYLNNSTMSSLSDDFLEKKEDNLHCSRCNLTFDKFELWREHQLMHIMTPNFFLPSLALDSRLNPQQIPNSDVLLLNSFPSGMALEGKRKRESIDDSSNADKCILDMSEQPKDKRLRTTILPEQLDYLYQKYQIESNPSRKMLETIAKEVGLKKRVVQVWFQNTRARERKGHFRAHSQAINKRCPFCPALFKVKSAFESHLNNKHYDLMLKGEVIIDNIPDEELSIDSMHSDPNLSSINSSSSQSCLDMGKSFKKYYEQSMKLYMSELESQSKNNDQNEENLQYHPTNNDSPLDLSKPTDSTMISKVKLPSDKLRQDNQNKMFSLQAANDYSHSDLQEKSYYDEDSLSENTDIIDEESSPTSPASTIKRHL